MTLFYKKRNVFRRRYDISSIQLDMLLGIASTPASRHCEVRAIQIYKSQADFLDCFVVPPRNDAKRRNAKRQNGHNTLRLTQKNR